MVSGKNGRIFCDLGQSCELVSKNVVHGNSSMEYDNVT